MNEGTTGTARRVRLSGYINEKKALSVIGSLQRIDGETPTAPIEVVINSGGGEIPSGAAIHSELRSLSLRGGGTHHVTTRVRGLCGSIATLVFEAGDERVGGPLDILIYHETRLSFCDEFTSNVRQCLESAEAWDEAYYDALAQRAKVSRDEIKALSGPFDREVLIPEAVEFGLADRVA